MSISIHTMTADDDGLCFEFSEPLGNVLHNQILAMLLLNYGLADALPTATGGSTPPGLYVASWRPHGGPFAPSTLATLRADVERLLRSEEVESRVLNPLWSDSFAAHYGLPRAE